MESMTGFATSEIRIHNSSYKLQVKSVNHRFFDFRWRASRSLSTIEPLIKEIAHKKLSRGSVEISFEEKLETETSSSRAIDYFQALLKTLEGLKTIPRLKIPSILQALILSKNADLWWGDSTSHAVIETNEICKICDELLTKLKDSRLSEGEAIRTILQSHVDVLVNIHRTFESKKQLLKDEIEESLKNRLKQMSEELLIPQINEERLHQELLVAYEKRDIQEELDRIQIHIESLKKTVCDTSQEAKGKRIDFLTQELNREWTTLGNKIRKAQLAQEIMEAKLTIEKIKEQAMNLL